MNVKELKDQIKDLDDETEIFVAPLTKVKRIGVLSDHDLVIKPGDPDASATIGEFKNKRSVSLIMVYKTIDDPDKTTVLLGYDEEDFPDLII